MVGQTPSFEPGNLSPEVARFALGQLRPGENVAVIGDNAAGKSRLVEKFLLHCPYDKVQYIAFRDTYGVSDSSYYLQKRWNQIEIDPEFNPTVRESLSRISCEEDYRERLLSFFHLTPLLDEYLISLSSGELRRFHLAKALLNTSLAVSTGSPSGAGL